MAPSPMQAVYEEIMLHRSAGDSSVMDNFEATFEAAEGWVQEEATCHQSFTRCGGVRLARRICMHGCLQNSPSRKFSGLGHTFHP